ncbi:MAG TPA: MFS transporter [Acidimicrobiia bacterium]|nr:MFS transporter [Acidimicrobiia bacterium]
MTFAVALLTAVKLVLNAGFRFVYPFLPAIGRGLGVDLGQMGVLLSVRWGAGFTAPLTVGVVDRVGSSRRLLLAGLISFGAGSLVTATSGVFVGAVVGFAFIGVGKPLFDIGAQTYVSERIPYRSRARSLGILELSWAGGFLLGAPLAGWLIDTWSWEAPFWVFGTIALIALGGVALVLEPSDGHHADHGESQAARSSAIVPFLAVVAIAGFTLELVFVTLGAWLEGSFGLTLAALAGVGAVLGVAELGGEGVMVGFTDRIGKRNSFAAGLGITAVFLVALSLVSSVMLPALIALFMVIMSLELAVISAIPLATELQPARRSRFLAWFLVAAGIGRIIADLVGPGIFENTDMSVVALTAAGAAVAGVVVLLTAVEEPTR